MESAPFTQYSVTTLDTIGSRFIEISKKNANTEVVTFPLFLKLEKEHTPYHTLIKKLTFSGMGDQVAALDMARDKSYSALRTLIKGFAKLDNAKGEAARALALLLEQAGNIDNMSYADEDSALDKLYTLFQSDEAKAHTTTLRVEDEVAQLFTDHNTFKQEYLKQTEANSALRQQLSASALRKNLEKALRNYYGFVVVMKEVEPWTDIYADLSEVLKQVRITNSKKTEEATENEQPTSGQ